MVLFALCQNSGGTADTWRRTLMRCPVSPQAGSSSGLHTRRLQRHQMVITPESSCMHYSEQKVLRNFASIYCMLLSHCQTPCFFKCYKPKKLCRRNIFQVLLKEKSTFAPLVRRNQKQTSFSLFLCAWDVCMFGCIITSHHWRSVFSLFACVKSPLVHSTHTALIASSGENKGSLWLSGAV